MNLSYEKRGSREKSDERKNIKGFRISKDQRDADSKTESSLGRTLAQQIEPSTDYHQIVSAQQETSEVANMILKGNVPLGGIHDLSYHLKRAEIGSYLYPKQLLEWRYIAGGKKVKRVLKRF